MASSGPSVGLPPGKVQAIYRYPVKGLSPERLPRVPLGVGATLPGDRLYAIENGPSGFDPQAPRYLAKIHYLMLMKNERLATLRSRYDDASSTLVMDYEGREAVRGDLQTADGRLAIEQFFAAFSAADLRGPPRMLHAPGFSFSDVASKVVSIINLASVAALKTSSARRSIRYAFAPMCMSTAGRPGANWIWSGGGSRSETPRGLRSSSASSGARRPTSSRKPASATFHIPRDA